MTDGDSRKKLLQLTDGEWFKELGSLAASIGTHSFHQNLLRLLARCIQTDSGWIIRYSRVAPPDVLYTSNVSEDTVKFYNNKCLYIDPFSLYWRTFGRSGVRTLAELTSTGQESALYSKIFTEAANISDEMGVFFSTVGHCCFAVFLEREKGFFTAADVQRAKLILPALEGFHRSHLEHLFNNLRYNDASKAAEIIVRPTLIRDRNGAEVFANEAWKTALTSDESVSPILETIEGNEDFQMLSTRDYLLRTESFDRNFPLAPGGRIFILESKEASASMQVDYQAAAAVLQALTPRERGVLSLIMQGNNTGQIAQRLSITKGTIKNCKLRIYRKAGVSSERYLVKQFGRLFPPQ
jgi:DNA-binding CsgD family transcriptional regulator